MKLKNALLLKSSVLAFAATEVNAQTTFWEGDVVGTGAGLWSNAGNWSTGTVPTGNVQFDSNATANFTNALGNTQSVTGLTFDSATSYAIRLYSSLTNTTARTLTVGTGGITVNSGEHTILGAKPGSGTSGSLVLNSATFNIASGSKLTLDVRINEGGGGGKNYLKLGGGTLVLNAHNGGTSGWVFGTTGFIVSEGTLQFAAGSAYGNTANKYSVSSGAALEITGGVTQSIGTGGTGTITLNGNGINGTGALRSRVGNNTFGGGTTGEGGILLATDSSIGVDADILVISQMISNSGNLTKVGAGTLTLSHLNNSYTGATNVNAGTLNITGSTASGSAVTVGGSAASGTPRLAGSGTVNGAVTVKSAGTGAAGILNAGNSTLANKVGTLAMGSTLAFESGSTFEWDLNVDSDLSTSTYDKVTSAGALTGGAALFKIVLDTGDSFADAFWDSSRSWNDIFGGAGAPSTLAGIFSGFDSSGGISSTGVVTGQGHFTLSNSANSLTWTPIPEPGTALGGLLLTAGLLRRRRKHDG